MTTAQLNEFKLILENYLYLTQDDKPAIGIKCIPKIIEYYESIRAENLVSQAASQACAVADIEFRPNMEDIDEIVANNADIHLEYMSDSSIWMSITVKNEVYHIHINPRNPRSNAYIKTWAEQVG